MTVRLLDTFDGDVLDKDPLAGALDASTRQAAAPKPAATPESQEPDLPEPYRDKSVKDLLEIIRAKEAMIGRQSQDVGVARSEAAAARALLDKALQFNTSAGRPDQQTESRAFTADDLLKGPQEVVQRIVRDELQGTQAEIQQMRQNNQAAHFSSLHPSANTDLNDPKFTEWFNASSYRQKLAAKVFADPSKTDWEAADELWSGYESARSTAPKQEPTTVTTPSQQPNTPSSSIEDVALMRGGSGGGAGDPGSAGKERFKASALTAMQAKDPDLYWSPSVQKRINEGVVIDDL